MARSPDGPTGLLVVDKPAGWTSHDVVGRTRRVLRTRRVGHAGTLDPMATGVLVLGVGRATRLLTYLVGADKEYEATVRLGVTTSTEDAEGDVTSTPGATTAVLDDPDAPGARDALTRAVAALTGPIQQVPSAVSAIKVDGRRAYARVRDGEQVELAARPVVVHGLDVRDVRGTTADEVPVVDVDVVVACSSGTYVRALARDLGAALGVGGHLVHLRRTRVGPWTLEDAVRVDGDVEQVAAAVTVVPVEDAARAAFDVRELDEAEARALAHGRRIGTAAHPPAPGGGKAPVAAFAPDGTLVGLVLDDGTSARPVLVLAPAGQAS